MNRLLFSPVDPGGGGGGDGVTDHGDLTGLADDDHSQYHTDARGDARYHPLSTDFATQVELDAHLNDAADAHDASAISILDSGADFTATDVEGALAELQADHEADASALTTHESDTTSVHGIADTSTLYRSGGTDVALADGGTGASLVDPNADRILFWDDSAGAFTWLTPGTGLTITGTQIDAAGGASNVSLCRLAANSAISSTTKSNLAGMVFTLAANTVYSFEFLLMCSANAATVGIQYAITFPGTITRFDGNLDYYITVSDKGSVQNTGDATSPFDFNPTVSHGNVVLMNRLIGTIEVGASGGAFQLQHGSETATLTTVLRGSYGVLYKH